MHYMAFIEDRLQAICMYSR